MSQGLIHDLELTDLKGNKLLVNAFDIAIAHETGEGTTELVIKDVQVVPGAHRDQTSISNPKVLGFIIEVLEPLSQIKEMRRQAAKTLSP